MKNVMGITIIGLSFFSGVFASEKVARLPIKKEDASSSGASDRNTVYKTSPRWDCSPKAIIKARQKNEVEFKRQNSLNSPENK